MSGFVILLPRIDIIACIPPKLEIKASYMVEATKIVHSEQARIKMDFYYNQAYITRFWPDKSPPDILDI